MTIRRPQAAGGPEAEAGNKSTALVKADAKKVAALQKRMTGTTDEDLGNARVLEVAGTFSRPALTEEQARIAIGKAVAALMGLAPSDEVEGMLAAQMIAAHNTAMECTRRANAEQSVVRREQYFRYAAKFMALYPRQVEALDRHRGKGPGELTVGNVTVNAGGQAIVGHVESSARGPAAAGTPGANPPHPNPAPNPAPPAAAQRVVRLITKPTR